MSQTKRSSISEVISNIIPGYIVNYGANWLILSPFCSTIAYQYVNHDYGNLGVTFFWVGVFYTFVSVARQYLLRRAFNKMGKDADFYTLTVKLYHKLRRK